MLVALGAAGAASDGAHLGDFPEEVFGDTADAGTFLQRGAGGGEDEDGGAAFVEWREEFPAEEWHEREGAEEGDQHEGEDGFWNAKADRENAGDEPFEKTHDRAVLRMRHAFHVGKKVGAERRRDGDGDEQAGGDGDDVGEAKWGEDAAFDATEREEGNENQNDDECGEDDGISHLAAGGKHDSGDGLGIGREAVLAQAAEDIFDIHDGVVHQLANRDGEAAEGHGVDAEAEPFENDERDQKRQGNGGERDEGRSEIQEKQQQDDRNHDAPIAEGLFHIRNGALDEVCLAEDVVVDSDALGQGGTEGFEFLLDRTGELDGVGAGLFGDGEHDARLAVDARLAAFHEWSSLADFGDVAEKDVRAAWCGLDDGVSEVGRILDSGEVADEFFLVGFEEEAAGGIHIRFAEGCLDLVERDAIADEFRGIDEHLVFLEVAALDSDLGNSGDREESALEVPLGKAAEFHRADLRVVTGKPNGHDLAHDRGDRAEEGSDAVGEGFADTLDALGDDLAGEVDVGLPIELHEDEGEAYARKRAHALDMRRAIDSGFERERDEGFHLLGSEAGGFGEDGDGGAVEVWKNIHRQAAENPTAIGHDKRGEGHDEKAVPDGEGDDAVEHFVLVAVAVVVLAGGFRAEVLELVVADCDDFFVRQDAFEDFDEISRADAGDDLAFFKLALVIFDIDEKFTERAENGAARNGDDRLGLAQGNPKVPAEVRTKAVVGIGNRGVEMEPRILGGVAGVEPLKCPGEFLAGENIQREGGSRADPDFVEFGRLENQALSEELRVITDFDKCGFRRECEAGHGILTDHMPRNRRCEGLGGTAHGERSDAHDGIACLDLLAEFHKHLEHAAGEGCADRAVFLRRHNEDGGNLDRGAEFHDGSFSGFEAEVFALGVGEGDGAGVRGGAHLRAVVVTGAGEQGGDC